MGIIYWLLVGLVAGSVAKMITPQKERGGWISSIIIGMGGAVLGGFLAGLIGFNRIVGYGFLGSIITATLGALLILFIYHRYLKR